ncbi:MAG: tRNA (guanosine(37)-N1)-methyltransferase TrmD [Bacillota bacterium]|nr:tRNA (guanosine(37)-N1)-methyltransferase TrmD [Bacillota bacterium]
MKISVLTLFPELIETIVASSVTGRALADGHFELETVQIRDFAGNRYGKVDDSLYGGGTGLLMQCEPVWQAWQSARSRMPADARSIVLSPKGRVLDQALVDELAAASGLILICGHYEGIDERVLEAIGAEPVSLGDYVLTGGELGAAVLIDAVSRQLPGVLPDESAWREESHIAGRLECRQYTKPETWRGRGVPEVLRSGHHARIAAWRRLDGLAETLAYRPDLFCRLDLDEEELTLLWQHMEDRRQETGSHDD